MDHEKIKGILLLVSVFLTGAAVLIVEIVATRILSPYYGNTIYTTSSVIGIILAALSLGYYLGGNFADKYPYHKFFYGIIAISGAIIIITQILGIIILPFLSILLSISSGPFVSSIILFLVPAFFLGMLSPFAIKLNSSNNSNKVGSESGQVFFWSTLGSIAGSFLSGFVFIPHFGINSIIFSTGIFLVLWGAVNIVYHYSTTKKLGDVANKFKSLNKKILLFIILLIIFLVVLLWSRVPKNNSDVIYEKDGIYEKIVIRDTPYNNQPARLLVQDKSISSGMYLNSDELAFNYSKYYVLYKLFNFNPKTAFFIGGGAYSIPKDILNKNNDVRVDVAEIEPELFTLAKKYFGLTETDRLKNHVEDGRRFLAENSNEYDIIMSDVYDSFFSLPAHLTTHEFFILAKSRLSNEGVFIGNFAGSLNKNAPSFMLSEIKTFMRVFPNSYFFAVNSKTSEQPQNIIFLGINGSKKIDFNSSLVLKNKDPIIKTLEEKNIDISSFNFDQHQEFTDDYSPVEYFVKSSINKWY